MDPNFKDAPYSEQFHIGVAHQLVAHNILSVDFTHILGLKRSHVPTTSITRSTVFASLTRVNGHRTTEYL